MPNLGHFGTNFEQSTQGAQPRNLDAPFPSGMWTVPRLAGLLGVILASVFAIVTLVLQVPLFFNQCHEWGSSSAQLILQESGPCSEGVSSSSETRGGALMRTFLIQGGTLLAVGLGLAGVLRGNSAYCVLAAAILFAESVPLVFGGWAADRKSVV